MKWKRWKMGLAVAIATGFFTGLAGFALGLTWKAALMLLAGSIGKDAVLFMKDHPIDSIVEDSPAETSTHQNPS